MTYQIIHHSEELIVHWYPERGIAHAIFMGELRPEVSTLAYKISNGLLAKYGIETYRGVITDFCQVTKFNNSNIIVARNQSRQINAKMDLSRFPIAILVETLMQRQMVWLVAKVNGTDYRSKIVYTLEEGFEFIDEYRAQYQSVSTIY